ncbi:MAG: site-2 protease family protein [Candidatus Thermoplasmatota archaeon]|jgi:membrane-associated protease RseP (regulator of RpoE activity)|nr:site-2 protease family protein [Candidatus Thermoplasmatota archaeon]MCL5800576.1 site-2 protease family protein [Candidatus Thermoplasmatota archaeon]
MINGLYAALIIVLIWIAAIFELAPRIRKSAHFSLLGPALMIKSPKNRGVLDKFSRIFPKELVSRASVVIVMVTMLGAFVFLFYEVYLTLSIKVIVNQPASYYIALPGINPFIPIFYGTLALVVGVVIHELMHGVLARKHNITVKSVGALFFVVPIGAFVEPDETEMTNVSSVVRRRVFAAGPATNIVLSIIFFLLLISVMAPLATPTHDGIYLQGTEPQAVSVNNLTGMEITSFGNYSGNNLSSLGISSYLVPGMVYNVTVYNGKVLFNTTAVAGIMIYGLLAGYPASDSNLSAGDVLISIQNRTLWNQNAMNSILDGIAPGTSIRIEAMDVSTGHVFNTSLTTASKYDYYNQYYPLENSPSYRNQSFLGVTVVYAGLEYASLSQMSYIEFGGMAVDPSTFPNGLIQFIILPLEGLSPVPSSLQSLYSVPFSPAAYWIIVNSFYWLFWMNFLLGLTNALPLFILDGGQFFKDTLTIASKRKSLSFLTEERVRKLSNFFGLLVFFLLMWNIIAPRLL